MRFDFGAYVTETLFDRGGAAFALGDGTVRWDDGAATTAHDGAILHAAAHPSGEGVITGGDDGRLVWSRRAGADLIAETPGRWIDALAVCAPAGLIAFAAGREVQVLDAGDRAFERRFRHDRSVAAIAFEAKGRRLAAATYGGVALWYARIGEQKPVMLRWAGSHVAVAFSPDGRFVVSAMQENALHGWRLSDTSDMRMGGYPAKPRSLTFLAGGAVLATSGANGVVLWPFSGGAGPMGKQAEDVGHDESALVTRVAVAGRQLAAGRDDGRVWISDLAARGIDWIKSDKGPPITALAIDGAGRVAWGDEQGGAGVGEVS
ncbi:MAG TPA: WD40 repeat domain-containing protein [Caulobacteraceae bacterium]|nr:WD40 repeat domain-containing protein [Caulobacteraceae bacterium]